MDTNLYKDRMYSCYKDNHIPKLRSQKYSFVIPSAVNNFYLHLQSISNILKRYQVKPV